MKQSRVDHVLSKWHMGSMRNSVGFASTLLFNCMKYIVVLNFHVVVVKLNMFAGAGPSLIGFVLGARVSVHGCTIT